MRTGRKPVTDFEIITISDVNDPRLIEFRERIYSEDLGIDVGYLHEVRPHSWWMSTFDEKVAEDAFKYCDDKWSKIGFDCIECVIENDKVVGMSGCKQYGNYLRTSMNLYLLKSVRAKYPGLKYLKGGWFERHLTYANGLGCGGVFFTVYAYSRKLKGLINNHRNRVISLVDKEHLLYIDDVKEKGEYTFNNVPQTFFYYPLSVEIERFDPNEFI